MLKIDLSPFPVIETERLLLRKISLADELPFFEIRSDEQAMKYIDRPRAKSPEDAVFLINMMLDLIARNQGLTWAITRKEDPVLIGTMHLWKIDPEHHRAEIGYMLNTREHRKGYMQEAILPVIRFGFSNLKLHSIEACVNPANQASIALLEKNGFVREAYFKENYFFQGKFLDTAIYSLITPENDFP
jgi:ribosomal-protein-alanine N-acetyltransferase